MYSKDGLFHLLMKINHKVFMCNFCMLKDKNLHPGQMPLLVSLCKKDGLVQRELADKLDIKPSTLNVMIHRLEKNGFLIKKQDSKDQRKSRIYISEYGKNLVESVKKRTDRIAKQADLAFTKEERNELQRLLMKLDACMDQQMKLEFRKEKENA